MCARKLRVTGRVNADDRLDHIRHVCRSGRSASSAARLVALDVRADLNGLGYQGLRSRKDDFFNELANAVQHRPCVVRMDRRQAPWMARVPCLKQRQSCRSISDFADDDPVRLESQRNLEALQLVKLRRRQHAQTVCRIEQKLLSVFDHQDPIAGRQCADLFEDGIRNGCLSRSCASDDEHVLSSPDGFLKHFNVVQAV